MSTSLSIHPHGFRKYPGGARMRLETSTMLENANAVTLTFMSLPGEGSDDIWQIENAITVYHLDGETAEILGAVGNLDAKRRAALLPVLRHMLDEIAVEEEVEADV